MKKNVFSTGVNESFDNSRNQIRVKDNNRYGDTNRASLSDVLNRDLSSRNLGPILDQAPHQGYSSSEDQVARLQEQVDKLKLALERLTLSSSMSQVPTNTCNSNIQSNETVTASQLSQLSVSINQLYSGMFALQRDVSYLTERLSSMETRATGVRRESE